MRIDSVVTAGSDLVYYPYHTTRGNYLEGKVLDSTGGSWLGKRVIQQADGAFLFDNMWSDTVIIRTQAHAGDSWIFYNDTTSRYHIATVTAEDTMTVMGMLDSVKKIKLDSYTSSGPDLTDSINNFQVVFSKEHGFVTVMDLYTFPYHKPDTLFGRGVDYFLDEVTGFSSMPPYNIALKNTFSLTELSNPTSDELYDWHPGDVFQVQNVCTDGYPCYIYYDSIISRTAVSGGTQYGYVGWDATMHIPRSGPYDWYHEYPYDTGSTSGTFFIGMGRLVDTTLMPEEVWQEFLQYQKEDTSVCIKGWSYDFYTSRVRGWGYATFHEVVPLTKHYKMDLGLISYSEGNLGTPPRLTDTGLIYYRKGTTSCGYYNTSFPINNMLSVKTQERQSVTLIPNPVSNVLEITNSSLINHVSIYNAIGQVLFEQNYNSEKATVDMKGFSSGIYFVRINESEMRKIIKN